MVTCSCCHHGIDRLTAVTTHGYTCTQHLSLTVPTVCDYKYCRASHHSSNSYSHFLTKRAITHPWAFVSLEICAYLHVRLFSIMCAEALLFTGCSEQQKKKATVNKRAIGFDGWAHFTSMCLPTSAHVRGGGKRQRILCCHSNKEESYPQPQMELEKVRRRFRSACVWTCGLLV